jgi:hypothetical protein
MGYIDGYVRALIESGAAHESASVGSSSRAWRHRARRLHRASRVQPTALRPLVGTLTNAVAGCARRASGAGRAWRRRAIAR